EVALARRQLRQRVRQGWRQAGQFSRDLGRRKAIWLGKDNVDADDARVPLGNAADELGHQMPRPRPLPVLGEALLVDVDDRHSCRITGARPHFFYQVEAAHAQFGDDARVDDPQHQSACDQYQCRRAARTAQQRDAPAHSGIARHISNSSPSYAEITSTLWPDRLISSKRMVSATTSSIIRSS